MKLIKINTIMKKIFFFIVTTTMTLFMAAQGAGGHIYQQDPFGHFQSHYWPDYIDGVNSLRPECFEYSSGEIIPPNLMKLEIHPLVSIEIEGKSILRLIYMD